MDAFFSRTHFPGSHKPQAGRVTPLRALRCVLGLCFVAALTWCATPGLASASQSGPQPIVLTDTTPVVPLWSAVMVLSDPAKNLTLEQVLAAQGDFKVPETATGTLGLRTDAVWVRVPFSVAKENSGLWVLDINYPVINRIDVFVMARTAPDATAFTKVFDKTVLGNLQPREQRTIAGRVHSFGLVLKPGDSYELYLRVENTGAMILPLTLNRPSEFHGGALAEQMLQGLLTGLALCLLIYSLAHWVTLREPLFFKYAIVVFGSLLFSLLQFGVGGQYLWGGNVWMELHVGGLSALIASTGSFLFVEQALAGPDMRPWLRRLMKIGAGLTIFSAVCYAFDLINVQQVTAIVSTLGIAPSLLGLPGAIKRARRGDSVGIYFLLAWAVYFVTTAILIEVIKGRVEANFWTLHSFQFGATFDMLLFMRVLGLRTKALQTAVQTANLERDSLHSLANTDPLTGLANRRSLHSSITAAIQHAGPEKILAVYMLDLDGFKGINDQYGHDVGDELLIAVASRLKANLRNSDIISRLGGDEFLVMSSGLNTAQQAHELGEKLLKAFGEAFLLSGQTCRIGMTIGYALAPQDGQDTVALLKRADAGMYAGKVAGKNCVRRLEGAMPAPGSH